jgi:hypothetical protein
MIYLKSVLVGLGAVFTIFVVIPILAILGSIFMFFLKHGFEGGVGIDMPRLRWVGMSLVEWLSIIAVFAIGYLATFRWLAKR